MTKKLFGRSFLLELGNSEQTLCIDALRIKFKIKRGAVKSPDTATFDIYGLNDAHRNLIISQFNQVRFSAGYGQLGLLYHGEILFSSATRNGNDIVLQVTAGDGLTDYSKAMMSTVLKPGADDKTIIQECLNSMSNITATEVDVLASKKLTRSCVLFGRTRRHMSVSAANQKRDWLIHNTSTLRMTLPETASDEIVLLSEESGMINAPERTKDGVLVECLINPRIQLGSHIALQSKVNPDVNGELKVIYNEMIGDTTGKDWYMKLTCANGKFSPMKPEKFVKTTAATTTQITQSREQKLNEFNRIKAEWNAELDKSVVFSDKASEYSQIASGAANLGYQEDVVKYTNLANAELAKAKEVRDTASAKYEARYNQLKKELGNV